MRLESFGSSHVGMRRSTNEDSYLGDDDLGFFVVADGVGGRAKGEVASSTGVEEAYGFVHKEHGLIQSYLQSPGESERFALRRLLESAVQYACYMVYGLAEQDPNRMGMSTTMSALLIAGHLGVVAQVGDSRIYRRRAAEVIRLTEDHTLVNYKLKQGLITAEEAARAPGKNIITRAVGNKDYVQVDTTECDVFAGDRFLLCSDGLHTYFDEDELGVVLGSGTREEVATQYIDLANARGGRDNITVLIVDVI